MYIGIDLGTSGVKVILLNEQGEVVAAQTEKLTVCAATTSPCSLSKITFTPEVPRSIPIYISIVP